MKPLLSPPQNNQQQKQPNKPQNNNARTHTDTQNKLHSVFLKPANAPQSMLKNSQNCILSKNTFNPQRIISNNKRRKRVLVLQTKSWMPAAAQRCHIILQPQLEVFDFIQTSVRPHPNRTTHSLKQSTNTHLK